MPKKSAKPREIKRKKIYCIRLDETYVIALEAILGEYMADQSRRYNNAPTRAEQIAASRSFDIARIINLNFQRALAQAEVPRMTTFPGLNRIIMAEFNRMKSVGETNGLNPSTAVPDARPARRA